MSEMSLPKTVSSTMVETYVPRLTLFAGGGSGGHVFPGLAVAVEMESRGWEVDWAGSPDSMEEKLVQRQSMRFHRLSARPVVGRGPVAKIGAVATLLLSAWSARGLMKKNGVEVVLGTGGYVSAPAVLGARLAGIPALILEPNAEAGLANRTLSRWTKEALLAHDSTAEDLRCSVTTSGIPVREEFFAVAPSLPFGAPLRILVLGGSQGARRLNQLLPAALEALPESLGPVVVRHQCGKRHVKATQKAYEAAGFPVIAVEGGGFRPDGPRIQVEVAPFLHDMAAAMAESHLIVSRAGAITLAEICAAGRPSILLPLSLAAGHQYGNAMSLKDAGAAEVVADDQDEDFTVLLSDLLGDRARLDHMASSARALGRDDAAQTIADRLEHWAGPGREADHV